MTRRKAHKELGPLDDCASCRDTILRVMKENDDRQNRRLDIIEKNQLVAKVTVSILMGVSLVLAWAIDHANLFTGLFGTAPAKK